MRLLTQHIAKQILSTILVVLLALIGLQLFILFVNQISDMGRGGFGLIEATRVVCFQLPYQVCLFFPMASLLGVLIGLGQLANQRELVVMRAAGVSITQISRSVLMVAFVLMLLVSGLSETIVPKFTKLATDEKVIAIAGGQALRSKQGVWFHQPDGYIFVGSVVSNHELKNVVQFKFDATCRLKIMRHIRQMRLVDKQWLAEGVDQTNIDETQHSIKTLHQKQMVWNTDLNPAILNLSSREADEMNLGQLYSLMRTHSQNPQTRIELAFWQRVIQPFSTLVMMLLGIPFIFGPLRASPMGVKIVTGACCGFVFYILNHLLGSASQIFQISPFVAAVTPTILFALVGAVGLRRMH